MLKKKIIIQKKRLKNKKTLDEYSRTKGAAFERLDE